MKTTLALLVLFIFVLGGGYYVYSQHQEAVTGISDDAPAATTTAAAPATSSTTQSAPATANPTPSQPATTPSGYTAAQVAAHNTSTNCWTSINGSVYDLTAWIKQHPGGQSAILSICGRDGTQAFEGQHGNPRDTRPQQALAAFRIGALAS